MKFSCTKENIKQGLVNVAHIAGKNVNLPILSNVLITCADNIILSATDLEIGVQALVRGKIEQAGTFTVNAKLLTDYINLLPNDRIDFELAGSELSVVCKNYKTKIKGEGADDYPIIPAVTEKELCRINFKIFKQAVLETIFSTANNETRIELSGLYFEFNGKELVLAATDSYRLAERVLIYNKNAEKNGVKKIIIPTKTLQEVVRLNLADKDGGVVLNSDELEVIITLSENQVLFQYDDIKLVSRTIDGQYPEYRQIIPTDEQKTTTTIFNRHELIHAIKASALFSRNNVNDINLDFPGGKDKAVVSSLNTQSGESVIEISAEVSGKDNGIVLNYRYLLDGLNALDCERVVLEVSDANTPCVLKAEGRSDYLYIIMPIKQ